MRRYTAALLFLLAFVPRVSSAQETLDAMSTGILAFREGRYTDAVTSFERAAANDSTKAEAHFLLARIYFETPLRDVGRAGRELQEALKIEPDNVEYLVARMQQLRAETWSFILEKIQEQQRVELARKILKIDSTNAFAHEELGILYIRDFWRYRNAIMMPKLIYSSIEYRGSSEVDPLTSRVESQMDLITADPNEIANPALNMTSFAPQQLSPDAVFLADQFNVNQLSTLGVPIMDLSGRAQRVYDMAVMHLKKALESDPRHRPVYDELMEIYSLKGEWAEALRMLQQMYVFFPDDPDLWTYLGLAHYRAGNVDAASKAFESSLQYMGDEDRQAYTDLSIILSDEDKVAYAADPAGFTARYWTSKDPRYLTPSNERKIEHYSRLTYAELLYAAPDVGKRGWQTQRGSILVRYGVPVSDVVIIPRGTTGVQQASQLARSTPNNPGGVVSETLTIAREGTAADLFEEANTYNVWDFGDFKFVFEDPFRNGEYRLYSPPASALSAGALPWVNDYIIKAGETFREIPDRYDFQVTGRQIELPYLVAAFRGEAGQTDLMVNYGIPLTELPANEDIINITANAGMFVVNSDRDVIAERRRTIYGLRTEQVITFDEANLWVDSERLTVDPGKVDVSVEFETTSGGTSAVQRRSVDVPDFSGSALAVSDIMLAYRVEETEDGRPHTGADIVRNGFSILPSPWSVFAHTRPVYLYYEVYNLTRGQDGMAAYDVDAALVPKDQGSGVGRLIRGIFGGGRKGVSAGAPNTVAATTDGNYLILDAANQEPGLYTLRFTVRDRVSGKETQRTLDLFLE